MKIKSIIKKIKYYLSTESCYSHMEHSGSVSLNCCNGMVGGDKETGNLSYMCVNCKYFVYPSGE